LQCDKKIIVVGAGIAGLTVARQLTFFGYKNVQVYEARNRIGGRVLTLNTFDRPVDLGAMITTGVIGNPCHLLARQLRLEEYVLRPSKTQSLYDVAGARIPKADDRKVDILFNHLLEHACKHRARYAAEEAEETQGRIRQVLSLQNGPRSKAVETSENGNSRTGSGEYAKSRSGRKRRKIDYSLFAEEDISGSENTVHDQESNRNEYPSSKCQGADGVATASANSTVAEMDISLDKALKKAAAELPSAMGKAAVSMNLKLLMEWNRANLEFGCAGELEKVSNTHWDQDDAHGFMGDHVLIHGGYGQLCDGLAKDLNINLSSPVKKVVYKGDGGSSPHVPIRCSMPQQKGQKGYDHASRLEIQLEDGKTINDVSAVVVAVPLGCLQQKEKFQFCPELPRRKRESIAKMGAGNLNKIVMQFAHCFWDPDDDMFGRVTECLPNDSGSKGETDPAREARGYAYMFASLPTENGKHPPVLISFMAGKASYDVEKVDSDADIVSSVLGVLRKMYGKEKVPMGTKPVHSVVTRWGTDPYSKGAYSYVSVGCSGDDYDIIADPAFDGTVYFAGEHTNRNHPTTCAGAMLSVSTDPTFINASPSL
jgi:monoamine oxidase